jgi:hypothetical protein
MFQSGVMAKSIPTLSKEVNSDIEKFGLDSNFEFFCHQYLM